jgi:phosphoribosylformylglycinamidine cyclo-ligase
MSSTADPVEPAGEGRLTYAAAGVDYGSLDPVKVLAQRAAAGTAGQLWRWGSAELAGSRGESAYVWEEAEGHRAFVVEGLGTKNLVADACRAFTGRSHYDAIAQDTVAAIVNDLVVVGAAPQVVAAYWAVGDSAWFEDRERAADLVRGWAAACEEAGAAWGGGETPALADIVAPGVIELGGACVGVIRPKERIVLGDRLAAGDAIVLVASSGIHANGLTLARKVAARLREGYATPLGDGRTYGEALLVPAHLYARFTAALFDAGVDVHYLVHVTGHGWRKLMRARRDFSYRVHTLPPVPPPLEFMVDQAGLSPEDAYGTFNMGAGFAAYVPAGQADRVVEAAAACGLDAWPAGFVEDGPRRVVIEPLGLTYEGESLAVRG